MYTVRNPVARAAAVMAVLVLVPGVSHAGNDEGVLFGTEAMLTAGAVTATTREGAAVWYNPAGLAAVPTGRLDVSGNAFMLRLYSTPAFIRSTSGGATPASVTEVISIPSSATYVRRLSPRVQFGFGLFVPTHHDITLRASYQAPNDARWVLTESEIDDALYGGAGLGIAITPTVRVGVSLFGSYQSTSGSSQFVGGLASQGNNDLFGSRSTLYSANAVSLEAGVGVQWQPHPSVSLGASLRSPGVRLYSSYNATVVTTTATALMGGGVETRFEPVEATGGELGFDAVSPLRARFGAGFAFGRASVAVDGDIALAHSSAVSTPREFNWNVRVGGRVQVTEKVLLGAGVFTDRSPVRAREADGVRSLDFYGVAAGVEFGNTHLLRSGPTDRLSFVTTLGVRYAYGVGEIDTLTVPAMGIDGLGAGVGEVSVHEIGLNLASTLRF